MRFSDELARRGFPLFFLLLYIFAPAFLDTHHLDNSTDVLGFGSFATASPGAFD